MSVQRVGIGTATQNNNPIDLIDPIGLEGDPWNGGDLGSIDVHAGPDDGSITAHGPQWGGSGLPGPDSQNYLGSSGSGTEAPDPILFAKHMLLTEDILAMLHDFFVNPKSNCNSYFASKMDRLESTAKGLVWYDVMEPENAGFLDMTYDELGIAEGDSTRLKAALGLPGQVDPEEEARAIISRIRGVVYLGYDWHTETSSFRKTVTIVHEALHALYNQDDEQLARRPRHNSGAR